MTFSCLFYRIFTITTRDWMFKGKNYGVIRTCNVWW